uniref:Oxytocin/vasopressin-related n=1 Tax=Styela plicata TaxID=7726 RepID=B5U8Z7_STYPL|nr:oxytocin/vasopressin-related precursor [Styela plicata]
MTSSHPKRLNQLICCVVIMSYVTVQGCYISDCPNSRFWSTGKREPTREKQTRSGPPIRKCPPCGLRGTGQCFSSRMCCTPALGCVIGENEITEPCRYESRIPVECASAGPTCMRKDREKGNVQSMGVCAADGLCCNADGCTYHHECLLAEKDPSDSMAPLATIRSSL